MTFLTLDLDPEVSAAKCFVVQVVAVPDLFLTAVKLSHDKTGAQYLHAARDDSNNLFRLVSDRFDFSRI